jgi:enoyl-CoA hydratase/carnithine racemase
MTDLLKVSHEAAVATVRFANPPRGYLNAAQTRDLGAVIEDLAGDPLVRVIVFTGDVPGVFIRHYDVGEILVAAEQLRASGASDETLMAAAVDGNAVTQVFDAIDALPKPTIAAINGYCQGGGFELALCCDLRIAEPGDFRIGLPEVNIGIFPGAGGTERLPRLIGEARALELILRGRTVGPEEAFRLGMVHELAPQGALVRAVEIARELAAQPAGALADAKSLVKNRVDAPLDAALARSRGFFSTLIKNDPNAEALMRAFLAEGEDINRKPPP